MGDTSVCNVTVYVQGNNVVIYDLKYSVWCIQNLPQDGLFCWDQSFHCC